MFLFLIYNVTHCQSNAQVFPYFFSHKLLILLSWSQKAGPYTQGYKYFFLISKNTQGYKYICIYCCLALFAREIELYVLIVRFFIHKKALETMRIEGI